MLHHILTWIKQIIRSVKVLLQISDIIKVLTRLLAQRLQRCAMPCIEIYLFPALHEERRETGIIEQIASRGQHTQILIAFFDEQLHMSHLIELQLFVELFQPLLGHGHIDLIIIILRLLQFLQQIEHVTIQIFSMLRIQKDLILLHRTRFHIMQVLCARLAFDDHLHHLFCSSSQPSEPLGDLHDQRHPLPIAA